MVRAGVFGEDRIELLEGVLVEMSPKGWKHEEILAWLTQEFVLALGRRFQVRVQLALTLETTGSAPEPDLAVVGPDAPRPNHPAEALLVVEVAASSLRYDRGVKAAVYAVAGIPEYWVVDVVGELVEVRTRPVGGAFQDVREARAGAVLLPGTLPGLSVDVSELFAAAR